MSATPQKPLDAGPGDILGRFENAILRRGLRRLVPAPVKALYRRYRLRHGVAIRIAGVEVRFRSGTQPMFAAHPDADDVGLADVEAIQFFGSHTRPGDWVADVGAFMGTYTLVAAAIAGPDGRVFAFEPTEDSRAELEDNVRLNGWQDRVNVVAMAVGQEVGEIEFFTAATSSTNSLFPSAVHGSPTRNRVPMTTLDAFFGERGRLPDLLKIDVEGAELHVLRGAGNVLDSAAHIVCELHPYAWQAAGHDFAAVQETVRAHGRKLVQLTTGEEVIVPRYGPVALMKTAHSPQ